MIFIGTAGGLKKHLGPVVIEPRHRTWFTLNTDRLLETHSISRAAVDPALSAEAEMSGGAREKLQYYRLQLQTLISGRG